MKIAILGYGREGRSIHKFLKSHPNYKKSEISVLDKKRDKDYLKKLSEFNIIFRSPGVPYNLPEIQSAIRKGIKVSSATKLFFDICKVPIIGVTGTKGKGTTATVLYKILKNCGKKVLLAGNIGKPALDILPKINKNTIVILELSSFQLQDLKRSPAISLVVDVFPDHLDAHKNMGEYLNAKANIAGHQKKQDIIFFFKDNRLSSKIARYGKAKKMGIDGNPFGLKKNFLMAATTAAYLGCPIDKIYSTLHKFKGVEHRLELVRRIGGVNFYNDSASTNPQTAAAAITSLTGPIILIAGGKDKKLDYRPLARVTKSNKNIKEIILIGENKNKIEKALKLKQVSFSKNLASALKAAYQQAKKIKHVSILLSPGAASFDMFKDYQDRGRQFKNLANNL